MRRWPRGGLWRHSDFLKLWSAETISVFGSQFTGLALPLAAVLLLDASPFAVSALVVVEFLPFILLAIPAGVWVDRMRRKPILVAGDLGRAALLGSIPLAYAFDALTLPHLYVVGFLVGVCTVFFDVAYQSYLPSLVERDQLVEGNSKLEVSRSTSQLAGPGAAGGIVSALGAPVAILLDAISFVVSAAFLFAIRKRETLPEQAPDAERPSMLADAREGLRFVVRNPYLRAISMCTGTANLFWSMGGAILVVYAVRELEMSPALLGLAFSLGNAGPLLAAVATGRISSRLGVGPTILWTSLLFSASLLFIPLATKELALPFLVASGVLGGFGAVAYNITQVSYRQAICPERMQGRMNAAIRFLVWGTMPLGALLGGTLGTWLGLRTALWIAAIGALFTFLPILFSPVPKLREIPAPVEEPPLPSQAEAAGGLIPAPTTSPAATPPVEADA
ncbi:MAG: MFS transporter [Actinobacteria bacterium]|nr:MFS transporter [Actinomycetota bacterium]